MNNSNTSPNPAQVTDAITYARRALGAELAQLTGGQGWVIRPDAGQRAQVLAFQSFAACRSWLLRHKQGLVTLNCPNGL